MKTLGETVKFVEVMEYRNSSNRMMTGITPTGRKITPYQKSKFTRDTESNNKEKCTHYGLSGHGIRIDRRCARFLKRNVPGAKSLSTLYSDAKQRRRLRR